MKLRHALLPCMLSLLTTIPTAARGPPPPAMLSIATWNLEWLLAPQSARRARIACRDGQASPVPCDVVLELARDSADLARIAAYVRELDADVVAFQEVEDAGIARRVFSGYQICITAGKGVQQVGFAVRPHIPHRCGPALDDLAAGGRSRPGLTMMLSPRGARPFELLAVHLKSGCSRDPLDSPASACRLLSAQADTLGAWMAERVRMGRDFVVLGDFNRVDDPTGDDPFWQRLDPQSFVAAARLLPFSNCAFGQPYTAYIDHVLVSRPLASGITPAQLTHLTFRSRDVIRYRLSDHCPVRVSLNLQPAL